MYIFLEKPEGMVSNECVHGLWRGVKPRKPTRHCYVASGVV
jgi:hypothetical protein